MSTPSQTIGPFFSFGMDWLGSVKGGRLTVVGTVSDGAGEPVPDALLELWQADEDGQFRGNFGRCLTDDRGHYEVATVKPGRVDDRQAPHIDVSVFARGLLQRVVTRLYLPGDNGTLDPDPLLAAIPDPDRRATLVGVDDGDVIRFDIRLQGDRETVFLAW